MTRTEQSREMARLGDTIDHVGNVIESADDLSITASVWRWMAMR
ncbi:hypothetical protein [Burkholderia ubonensis]